jgi:hypothetical protein
VLVYSASYARNLSIIYIFFFWKNQIRAIILHLDWMDREVIPALPSASEGIIASVSSGTKRAHTNGIMGRDYERDGSEAVDADSLSRALEEVRDAGRSREKTPTSSPSRKRQRIYGDRLVV